MITDFQKDIDDRAEKMVRVKSREDAEQAEQAARVAISARAECLGDSHYTDADAKRNPGIKYITPTPEMRPAMNKHYSDPAIEGMNTMQKALYGLPTAQPAEVAKPTVLKTQPAAQHPPRGAAYSDPWAEDAASRRAAELQQVLKLPPCTICREAGRSDCSHR